MRNKIDYFFMKSIYKTKDAIIMMKSRLKSKIYLFYLKYILDNVKNIKLEKNIIN